MREKKIIESNVISTILLSIIIPAYEYDIGIQKILTSLKENNAVEIIIFDDSASLDIENLVHKQSERLQLIYKRNMPALGAIGNWNALLQAARGEFVLLLHHDEYPLSPDFLANILLILENKKSFSDVYILPAFLHYPLYGLIRQHMPKILQSLMIKFFPSYLFRRNFIGPASALIVRRSLYPLFDINLKWLVDVELYYRLRKTTARWKCINTVKMASTQQREYSITKSLKQDIRFIDKEERAYLLSLYPEAKRWLNSDGFMFSRFIEKIFWKSFRVVSAAVLTRVKKI